MHDVTRLNGHRPGPDSQQLRRQAGPQREGRREGRYVRAWMRLRRCSWNWRISSSSSGVFSACVGETGAAGRGAKGAHVRRAQSSLDVLCVRGSDCVCARWHAMTRGEGSGANRALRHLRRLRRRLAGGGPGWWWVVKGGRPGTGTHWVSRARTRRHAHNENGHTRGKRSRSTMGMGSAHRRAAAPPARPRLCSPHSLCLSTLCVVMAWNNGRWVSGRSGGLRNGSVCRHLSLVHCHTMHPPLPNHAPLIL